jgi:heme O synthase-like polyprenyltransferase
MTKLHILIIAVLLGIWQLYWLISTWRKYGFVAALKLFAYGVLAVSMYEMSGLLEEMTQ